MSGELCRWRSSRVPDDKRMKMVRNEVTLVEVTSFVIAKGFKEEVM